MANSTDGEKGNTVAEGIEQGQQVEVALIAPDGTISIPQSEANLESVAIADVDLLLRFSDGTFVIIPNGALDAVVDSQQTVFFTTDNSSNDHQSSLGDLFKMVGITRIAGPGSVRVVSENVEVLQALEEDVDPEKHDYDPAPSNEASLTDKTTLSEPVETASSGAALNGKGPGTGATDPSSFLEEPSDPVVPRTTPRPSVYQAAQITEDISEPTVTLDANITADDIINIVESGGDVTVTGTVGGGARAGDIVTLTVNGMNSTGLVQGDMTFSAIVAGSDLVSDGDYTIAASITSAGSANPGTDTEGYGVDIKAPAPTVELDASITAADVVAIAATGGHVAITGTVGGDAQIGDTITLTVTGVEYSGLVQSDLSFSIDVAGSGLVDGEGLVEASIVSGSDNAGNPSLIGSDSQKYDLSDPEIIPGQTFSYAENQLGGEVVAIVSASDDVGVVDFRFTATGTNLSSDGFYTISSDGQISLTFAGVAAESNDFETGSNSFSYDIEAGDAAGRWSAIENITLNVTNVDEAAPVVAPSQAFNYSENQAAGDVVATVVATDDYGVTDFRFSGASADATDPMLSFDGYYTISSDGQITLTAAGVAAESNDFEAGSNSFTYGIEAGDASGKWSTIENITLNVTDVDEAAPVVPAGQTYSYVENQTIGDVVATVAASDDVGVAGFRFSGASADATDPTLSFDGYYTIAANGQVSITAVGVATLNNDFEVGPNSFTYDVEAGDAAGNWSAVPITLNVTDVNDNVPVITTSATQSVAENSTTVAALTSTDVDTVGTNPATFSITGGADAGLFEIVGGNLQFITAPDYETDPHSYDVEVTANDGVNDSAPQTITITLTDVNDNAPLITTGATQSFAENAAFSVALSSTDADTVGMIPATFTITGGADQALFSIDGSGNLTMTAKDYESPVDSGADNSYEVEVTANDGANTTTQTITVTVTDVNDNAPVITTGAVQSVAENAAFSVALMSTDVDTVGTNPATFTITGGADQALFSIDGSGNLVMSAQDYESPVDSGADNSYEVEVTADDGVNTTPQTIMVNVTDVNDNAPVITTGAAQFVAENSTTVAALTSTDVDTVGTNPATFSITGGADAGLFEIVGGNLQFITAPDYETDPHSYDVEVTANDGADDSLPQTITITLTDVNDNAPAITTSATQSVEENAGFSVALTSTDTDTVGTIPATFTITGGADQALFSIDGSGNLIMAAKDYESPIDSGADNNYEVEVTANDGANTTAQTITVTVTDVNDNAPVITTGAVQSVAENTAFSVALMSTDVDTVGTNPATFTITGGADQALFSIDGSGNLTMVARDYESPIDSGADNSYEVEVTANDGANTTAQTLTVTVTDVNDNAPVITTGAVQSVAENAAFSVALTTTDIDTVGTNPATFTITGGADQAQFSIDGSGNLVMSAQDYENPVDGGADNSYEVEVTADDGANTTTQTITVNVTDVNDNSPVITTGAAQFVAENNSLAAVLTSTDVDTVGANPTIFTITGGADAALFDVVGGTLQFITAPDYETDPHSYDVVVTANDGANSVTQAITITLTDVNDNTPVITTGATQAVAENAAFSVALTSTDADTVGTIPATFTITGGADQALFSIDGSGNLIMSAQDYESPVDSGSDNSYEVEVTANDGVNNAVQTITVNVTDVNDNAPVVTTGAAQLVAENSTLAAALTSTDIDTVGTNPATFTITGGADASLFEIVAGNLQFINAPDYETPLDVGLDNSYEVEVTANDGGNNAVQTITVNVVNVDEENPEVTVGQSFSYEAGQVVDAVVATVAASDDIGVSGYRFLYSDGVTAGTTSEDGNFSIASDGQVSITADGVLADVNTVPTNYLYGIQAGDVAGNWSSAVDITFNVVTTTGGIDTTPPVVTPGQIFSYAENQSAGDAIATVAASDGWGVNGYQIVSGNTDGYFTIANDGQISLTAAGAAALTESNDFETGLNNFTLGVQARDAAGNWSDSEDIFLNINDVNETPTDIALSVSAVDENVASGTVIATLSAIDPDGAASGFAGPFTYSLVAGDGTNDADNGLVTIVGDQLQVNGSIDFETNPTLELNLQVTDAAGLTYTEAVTVTVNDVNDPPIDIALSASDVVENATAGTVIATLSATDVDGAAGNAGPFTYSLVAGDGTNDADNGLVTIVGDQLQVNGSIDFETNSTLELNIQVTDAGGLTYTEAVTVTVNDVNETPTAINLSATGIDENNAAGAVVATLTATDPDGAASGFAGPFTYELVAGAGDTDNTAFTVVGSDLQINNPADFEGQNSFDIRLRVTDNGGLTFETTETITINDVNETPTDIALSVSAVDENVASGTVIATLSAIDPDGAASGFAGPFTYSLVAGDGTNDADNGLVTIVGDQLQVNGSIDFETNPTLELNLQVTDAAGLTYTEAVTVTVNDVNDPPIDIALSASDVVENATAGTVIATLSATDVDGAAGNAGPFTYSLVAGDGTNDADNGLVTIVGDQLQVNGSIDFETNSTLELNIQVTDAGGLTYTEAVTVTVNDVNETPTAINLSATGIDENNAAGAVVATLTATDPDGAASGFAGPFTYELVAGAGDTDNTAFTVVGSDLQINNPADFEGQNSFDIRLRVTDNGGLTFETTETITINDVNETPTDIALSVSAVDENVASGTVIATLSAIDPDGAASGFAGPFTYSLVAGDGTNDADNGLVTIVGDQLQVNGSIDFETNPTLELNLQVTDAAGLTYTEAVTVTVNDVNDPPIDIALSASDVVENATAGTVIATLSATDVDGAAGNAGPFTYSLVAGDGTNDADNGLVTIVGDQLQVNGSIDFETNSTLELNIQVTDAGGLTYTEAVTVTVNDVNETPTAINLSATGIDENNAAGAVVATLTATDPDGAASGFAGPFTYELVAGAGDTDNTAFTVVGSDLQINNPADFEGQNSFDIRLRVTDNGGLTFETTETITINDVNETPTDIALSVSAVDENVASGTVIATLSAIDPDGAASGFAGPFTYSLVAGDGTNDADNGLVTIVGDQLQVNGSIDFETNPTLELNLQVTDAAGLTYTEAVTVTVNDVNDPPIDIALSASDVVENATAGTVIATLSATDVDGAAGNAGPFTYSLVAGDGTNDADNGLVTIVGDQLQVNGSIDFETNSTLELNIQVTDAGGLTYTEAVTVTVNDVNETPTAINLSATGIDENNAAGAVVATLTATDPDGAASGFAGPFTYELVAGAGDTDNTAFTVVGSDLQINNPADFEGQNSFDIRLRVTDNGGLTFETTETITINDVNETPTDIALSVSAVDENVASGTVIATLSAIDPDGAASGFAGPFTYSLVAGDGTNDADNGLVTIVGDQLQVNGSIDFETNPTLELNLQVTDAAGLTYTEAVTVTVNDVNDPPIDIALSASDVVENATAGTVIATLSATDVDGAAGNAGPFTYSLVAGDGTNDADNGLVTIVGDQLQVNGSIDFETNSTLELNIQVTDAGGLTYTEAVTVTVNDVNETPTAINLSATGIDENNAAGAVVATLTATDPDGAASGFAGPFTYELVAGAGDTDNTAFTVVGSDLQINNPADFEGQNSFDIRLRVTDNGGLTFETTETITINDVNETPTDIALSVSAVDENVASGTVIATLSAIDPDGAASGFAGPFTYSLVAGDGTNDADNGLVTIVGDQLQVNGSIDFETNPTLELNLQVTDAAGLTYTEAVTVTVNDVNDPPIDIALSASDVVENATAGTVIATLSATDVDGAAGNAGPFTYSLVAGDGTNDADNGLVTIVGDQLQVNGSIDFETNSTLELNIQVTDAGGLTYTEAVTVTVNDVNETPTAINLSATGIDENNAAGAVVATLTATDPDGAASGFAGPFTYELVAGAGDTDNTAFTVVGSDLQINNPADFEGQNSFDIRLRVTDNGGLTFETTETITINDVNETPTDIALSVSAVDENVASGTVIATLSAIDPDGAASGFAGPFTYSLVAGDGTNDADNGLVTIVGDQLQVNGSIDFETNPTLELNLQVTDAAGLTYTEAVTVTVNDVNDPPIDIALSASDVVENATAGTVIATLSATDVDGAAGNAGPFTYSLVAGDGTNDADNGLVTIVGDQLQVNGSIDFETNSTLELNIQVTDAGGLTYTEAVTVTVNDVNETPTAINLSATGIDENNAAGAVVATLTATDPDGAASGFAGPFIYELVAGAGDTDNTAFTVVGSDLQINNPADFEGQNSFDIRLRVTDNGGLTFETTETITINDVNETPTDIALSVSAVDENVASGTVIATLSAIDPDGAASGFAGPFTYSLVAGDGTNDADNGLVTIVGDQLQVNGSIDFETNPTLELNLQVTDAAGLTYTEAVTVTVNDVNDPPIDIALSASDVVENTTAGTVIATLSATDVDGAAGNAGPFTYSLVAGDGTNDADNGLVTIVGDQLQVNGSIDFETNSTLELNIQVTDAGGLTYTEAVTVTVNDVNETPTAINLSATGIDENNAAGAVVATLTATDPDGAASGFAGPFTYELVAGAGDTDNTAFTVVGSDLQINNPADFEGQNSFDIRLRVTDNGGLTFETTETITINDVNETPTDIALSVSAVDENVASGTVIATLSAIDPDGAASGFAGPFTYSLVAGDGTNDADNGLVTIVGDQLQVNGSIDFETNPTLELNLQVTDAAGLTYTEAVTVTVNDVNDPPTISVTPTSADFVEDLDASSQSLSASGTVSFDDVDAGDLIDVSSISNGDMVWSHGTIDPGLEALLLSGFSATATDALPGGSTTWNYDVPGADLDFLAVGETITFSFNVIADDGNGGTAADKVTITITGTNDAPEISVGQSYGYAENQLGPVVVATVAAADDAGVTDFRFSGASADGSDATLSHDGFFRISSNGQISLTTAGAAVGAETNDFETDGLATPPNIYTYSIEASDTEGLWSTPVDVTLNVIDVDEGSISDLVKPVVTPGQIFSYAENQLDGDILAVVVATDNIGVNGYRFLHSDGLTSSATSEDGFFQIASNGVISLTPLGAAAGAISNDFETGLNDFTYNVQASDAAGNWSDPETIDLTVTDANDVPTDIDLSAVTVAENTPGAIIGTLSVTDQDAGDSHTITVDDARFEVVAGQLKLKDGISLDFETDPSIVVDITATDIGGLSYSESFTLTITDVNDAPTTTTVILPAVLEDSGVMSFTEADLLANASDVENDSLSVSGVTNATGNGTLVNNGDGTWDYTPAANDDTDVSFSYTITDDGFTEGLPDPQSVAGEATLDITPVNDAPVITTNETHFVSENQAFSVLLTSSDLDALGADPATFTITGGADKDSFSIDASGNLILSAQDYESPLDLDTNNSYVVEVTANDGLDDSLAKTITVNVINADEENPVVANGQTFNYVEEQADENAVIANVAASDDIGVTDFRIVSGYADSDYFAIDKTGRITLTTDGLASAANDYEFLPEDHIFTLGIQAKDETGNWSAAQDVTLNVTNLDEEAPVITLGQSFDYAENQTLGAAVATVDASDDVGVTDFQIVGGTGMGLFSIDENGIIRIIDAAANDYEPLVAKLFTLDIEASDAAGNTTSGNVVLNITDVDETSAFNAQVEVSDLKLKIGEDSTVTITFSEVVSNFGLEDLSSEHGAFSALSQDTDSDPTGKTWTATFTPDADIQDATNVITLNKVDISAGGNPGTGTIASENFAIDTLRPTATILVSDSNSDGILTVGETASVTFIFSEPVKDFTNADLNLPNGTLSAVTALPGDMVWTATFTPSLNNSDLGNVITLKDASIQDLADDPGPGNTNSGATDSNVFDIDTDAPDVLAVSVSDTDVPPIITDADTGVGKQFSIEVTFDQAMNNTVAPILTFNLPVEATLINPVGSWASGNTKYIVTYDVSDVNVDLSDITVDVSGAKDVNGNLQVGYTAEAEFSIDTINPKVESVTVSETDLMISEADTGVGKTFSITVNFSEDMDTTVDPTLVMDVAVYNTLSESNSEWTDSTTYTVTYDVADVDAELTGITVGITGAKDANGNLQQDYTAEAEFSIDTVKPGVDSVTVSDADLTISEIDTGVGKTFSITVKFTEAMDQTIDPALVIDSAVYDTLIELSSGWDDSSSYTVTYQVADVNAELSDITVGVTGAQDANGNLQEAYTAQPEFSIDTEAPVPFVTVNNVTESNSIDFIEAQNPLIPVTGTIGTVSGGPVGSYEVTVTVNGNTYIETFTGPTYSIDVSGDDLVNNTVEGDDLVSLDDRSIEVSVKTTDAAGNEGTTTLDWTYYINPAVPAFNTALYKSSEFKVTGATGVPAGSTDPSAAAQAKREVLDKRGENVDNTIVHNSLFPGLSSAQWTKALRFDFNVFTSITSIVLVANLDLVSAIPGFTLEAEGATIVKTGVQEWTVTPDGSFDPLTDDLDIYIVYDVDNPAADLAFSFDVTVEGDAGGTVVLPPETLDFSYSNATNESHFDVPTMVLPSHGMGMDIFAGEGDDLVESGAGDDIVHGNEGNDTLNGGLGNDTLYGDEGDDTLIGGAGADTLDGGINTAVNVVSGTGGDTASYVGSGTGVTVDLSNLGAQVSGGEASGDILVGIENVAGSIHDDTLTGNLDANILSGGDGDDILEGGAGTDRLIGGSNTAPVVATGFGGDTASYAGSGAGVTVDLSNLGAQVSGGDASGDILVGIENVAGSIHDDTLAGNVDANILSGGGGDDTLEGGVGSDRLVGGTNTYVGDTASYAGSGVGVTVDLSNGGAPQVGGDAEGDILVGIENLTGSASIDTLSGDGNDNTLIGGAGADTLDGGDNTAINIVDGTGGDTASYAGSGAGVTVNLSLDSDPQSSGGDASDDTLVGIENVAGSNHDDTLTGDLDANILYGDEGDDVLEGGAGSDRLEGGSNTAPVVASGFGGDTASYAGSGAGVTVNLSNLGAQVSGGDASGDILVGIENVAGSVYDDTLTGNVDANILSGGGGDDNLEGGAGTDRLVGGTNTSVGDTASYAGSGVGVTVDLSNGGAPQVGGDAEGDILVGIENLTGSDGIDTLIGDGNDNTLIGGAGGDFLNGGGNILVDLVAGTGGDTASYSNVETDIVASLFDSNDNAGEEAAGDTYDNIENLTGGAGDDNLTGDTNNNILTGGEGDDILEGLAGADRLVGGGNTAAGDTASYAASGTGVQVDLSRVASQVSLGHAAGDVLVGIENLIGGAGNDTLTGDSQVNILSGGSGSDNLYGMDSDDKLYGEGGDDTLNGGSGADSLDGGGGFDWADYSTDTEGVTASLVAGAIGVGGEADGDTYDNIEALRGGSGNDFLTGDNGVLNRLEGGSGDDTVVGMDGQNFIYGQDGNDILIGGVGIDTIYGGSDDDKLQGGDERDYLYGNDGVDELWGGDGNDTLEGGAGDDFLYGDEGDDILKGDAGNDYLEGGNHSTAGDTVDYRGFLNDISASLIDNVGTGADIGTDTYQGIENLYGGNGNDTLTGNDESNKLLGGSGNDTLEGLKEADLLYGGNNTAVNIEEGTGGDTASYANASAVFGTTGITASLTGYLPDGPPVTMTGDAAGDTYNNIENLEGSTHDDTLIGDINSNILTGGAGDDILEGMGGGDHLDGGAGTDTASYAHASADPQGYGVYASLSFTPFQSGDAAGDVFKSIENLTGSDFIDDLRGDEFANRLEGGLGDDYLDGGAGNDALYGGFGNDTLDVSRGSDSAYGGENNDTIKVSTLLVNQPTLVDGGADDGNGGDVMVLEGLVAGNYDLTSIVGPDSSRVENIETLDIRDGEDTNIAVTSQDIQNMVDKGDASQLSILADNGDTLDLTSSGEEFVVGSTVVDADGAHTDYTIYSDVAHTQQIAQINWHAA